MIGAGAAILGVAAVGGLIGFGLHNAFHNPNGPSVASDIVEMAVRLAWTLGVPAAVLGAALGSGFLRWLGVVGLGTATFALAATTAWFLAWL